MKKKPDPSQPDKLQLCICIDYRKVNQSLITTHKNSNGKVVSPFPLPKIQELLIHVNKCKYFSSLDLRSGYYHISLTEEAKKKTAFITADGNYQWNVVPFGLATAFSTFQYLMSTVLTGLKQFYFYLFRQCTSVLRNVQRSLTSSKHSVQKILESRP